MRHPNPTNVIVFAALVATLLFAQALQAWAQSAPVIKCPEGWPGNGSRAIALISDLHFGVGKLSDGNWDPTEDFRWSNALQGFLDALATCGSGKVDLVIAGDLLELWQPTEKVACKQSQDSDYGCTPEEMKRIAEVVITAHQADLARLGTFAKKGSNRLIIIPGNHDAALLLDSPSSGGVCPPSTISSLAGH